MNLNDEALSLWRHDVQVAKGLSVGQAEKEIQRLAEAENIHFRVEMARYKRKVRGLIAKGGNRDDLLALLHPNSYEMIEKMKVSGPWTLVLDECHHLLATWGYLVRAVIEELGNVFVVGLTATPPRDMDAGEVQLYLDLFGHTDFEVVTPVVVKEGDLAPYQELVYLTEPLDHEASYITNHEALFRDLLVRLEGTEMASIPFLDWLQRRVVERSSKDGVRLSWAAFERQEPDLAQAALRYFHHAALRLPEGARLHERHRMALTADDWVAMIEDYCMGYLRTSSHSRDEAAWEEIRRALPSLGYALTRRGIRPHVSPVDRVLQLSASKGAAALEILAVEREVLGGRLRALILCDYEVAGSELLAKIRGVLDPQAGSAALLLHILVADADTAQLNPILMTGRTVACSRAATVSLSSWIEDQVPELQGKMSTEALFLPAGEAGDQAWEDVVVVRPGHTWWQPRRYVPWITRYLEEGHSQCLVGTRGLLGEGWDAKSVNVLIDLTAAATSTAVHQMRGRSLRLDPENLRKVADNWDVVCVAPAHPKGTADYARFVRKHRNYYAPTAKGEILSGVSHVHLALSPYGPPEAREFDEINNSMLGRALDRDSAYDRWAVGEPYVNSESQITRVRFKRSIGVPDRRLLRRSEDSRLSGSHPSFAGLLARVFVALLGSVGSGVITAAAFGAIAGPLPGFIIGVAAGLVAAATGAAWVRRRLLLLGIL